MQVYQFTEQPYYPAWNEHSGSLRVNRYFLKVEIGGSCDATGLDYCASSQTCNEGHCSIIPPDGPPRLSHGGGLIYQWDATLFNWAGLINTFPVISLF